MLVDGNKYFIVRFIIGSVCCNAHDEENMHTHFNISVCVCCVRLLAGADMQINTCNNKIILCNVRNVCIDGNNNHFCNDCAIVVRLLHTHTHTHSGLSATVQKGSSSLCCCFFLHSQTLQSLHFGAISLFIALPLVEVGLKSLQMPQYMHIYMYRVTHLVNCWVIYIATASERAVSVCTDEYCVWLLIAVKMMLCYN